MKTEREYLAGLTPPLAQPGRGRFSNAAKEALAKARAGGMTFKSTTPAKVTPATPKAPKVVKAKSVETSEPETVESDEPVKDTRKPWEIPTRDRRPDRNADTYETASGVRKSVRDVCYCGYSIGWRNCATPTAIIGSDKEGKAITAPLLPVYAKR